MTENLSLRGHVNQILQEALTPQAIQEWWARPNSHLHGHTPNDLIGSEPSAVFEAAYQRAEGYEYQ